jgi:hypothetical protein
MPTDLKALARLGAEVRIKELKAEIESITKIFPHLQFGSSVSTAMPDSADAGGKRKKRRPSRRTKPAWSAAARKAVSERMKKYWAARKRVKKQ